MRTEISDIRDWLNRLGLGEYAEAFENERITLSALPHITDANLKELGLPMGPRAEVLAAASVAPPRAEPTPPIDAVTREAERRQITVMFCDLVGSTALSEKLDPEELRSVMQAYRKACRDVVGRYDGHVAQYLGDGLMVYFGWPAAHEDDAQRAVWTGLDIVDAVQALEGPRPLAVRVGIATGLVVVGESGADEGADAKLAVGETPNIAARIQGLAEPGTVAVAQSTRRLLGGTFALEDLGVHDAKGVSGGLQVHRVLGVAETESRFDASLGGALTPLVGRENEIAMLFERWDWVKDGEGQVILLSGEAGIGKSRVTQALRERLAGERHTRLHYQCSPYYSNSAFYPLIVQLERAAGFARGDDVDAKLDKLEALFGRKARETSLIAALLSLPIDRYPPLVLSPRKQKENTIAALVGQVVALAASQPVLMVLEDAHWIDPTTLETIGSVIEAIRAHAVLLVITYRPEFEPPWGGQAHITPLGLGRLGRKLGATLVAKVTGGKALPDEVLDQIVAKADGIPLFVEELTKTVLEAGFLKEQDDCYTLVGPIPPLAIPATLQDSLMARLDRLSPVKEVAQIGACIGREFSYELLATVSPLRDDELQDALQQLSDSELIFRRGTAADGSYTFKHAMIQDAAYQSLLKSKRQLLHQRIASSLKDQFEQTVQNRPELLAHHLTEAGNYEQAIPYWYQAGQLAFAASAFPEATAHIQNGLKLVPRIGDERARAKAELGLQTLLGLSSLSMYGFSADPVVDAFSRAEQLIEHAENATEIMPILTSLGTYHWNRANFPKADGYRLRAKQVAEEAHDEDLMVVGQVNYGTVSFHVGRGLEGIGFLEKALSNYDPARHRDLSIRIAGQDIEISATAWLAFSQMFLGYPDRAWAQAQRAVEMARAIRHPMSTASGLAMAANVAAHLRRPEPAFAWAEECIAFCEEQSVPFFLGWAKVDRGAARGLLGDFDRGIEDLNWAGGYLDSIGCRQGIGWINKHLAEIYLSLGKLDDAEDAVRRLLEYLEYSGETTLWPVANRLAGEVDFARNGAKATKAEGLFQDALRIAREQEYRLSEIRAATSLARLLQSQGKPEEAHDLLAPVYNWFTEGFDTKDLEEAKSLLDGLQ